MEKIFEIRVVSMDNMPRSTRDYIISEVSKKPKKFIDKFKGFAKITYVTASPKRIASIEPIEGTIIDYFNSSKESGVEVPTF